MTATRPIPYAARRLLCAQVLGVYAAMYWAPAASAAPTTPPASLAQVPEFLQLPPSPNVFITLDNSGSMALEYLPAGDDDNRPRLFPHPLTAPYSASGSAGPSGNIAVPNFVRFEHTLSVARARSASHNQMYYNPRIRYRPWKYADAAGNILSFPEAANPPSDTFALYHPVFPALGGLDLAGSTATAGSTSYTARLVEGDASSPMVPFALYYNFDTTRPNCDAANPADDLDCYERVEIKPSVATYTIPPGNQRGQADEPGCAAVGGVMICDYAAEFRNFANWFQYYRSRTLMARGAVGNALAELGPGFRVGFGLLNPTSNSTGPADGFSSTTVRIGVRPFEGANRKPVFDLLNNHDVGNTTPSARALFEVGQYFDWKVGGNPSPTGPWSNNPAAALNEFAACRQSYHVYVTDGYWNEWPRFSVSSIPPAAHDADNNEGPEICRDTPAPPGQPACYKYVPSDTGQTSGPAFAAFGAPGPNNLGNPNNRRFVSSEAQTLADLAMYYWYRDLQPAMPNIVTPTTANPAFWQNLSVIAVSLGLVGTKTHLGDGFLSSLDDGKDAWPTGLTPNGGDPKTIDDLWHAAVNSRGRMLLANDPQEFAARLASALQEIRARAATGAAAASNTAFLDSGNGIFTAEIVQGVWAGNLYRREIDPLTLRLRTHRADGTPLPRDANNNPYVWRASDMLPAPAARNIFTLTTGGTRVAFTAAGLDSAQLAQLNTPLGTAAEVIDYVRGDRSREVSADPPGNFRDRPRLSPGVSGSLNNPLGTFANSSPLYVKDDDFALDLLPAGTPGRDTYQAFVRANAGMGGLPGRTPLIWVGSNGGMFHAFNADTGVEVFAYVPRSVIRNLPELTKPTYQHRYFVDGVPASGDAYIDPGGSVSPSWRTVVIGSLGAGGRSVFAIDATDPAALGANSILWELDEHSLSPSAYEYLGHVFGPAFTARARNGKWVAVFGNGPESDRKRAALFIVDLETGAPIRIIDTGDGSNGNPNGLSTPAPVFDANQQLIAVYAGDLRGNLWKFDLSGTNEASWNVAFGGQPLFKARNRAGQRQPIFARPLLRRHPNGGTMAIFGTGKLFSPGDKENTDVQTLYGVWDKPSAPPLDDNFRSSSEMVQQAIKQKDVFDPSLPGDQPTNYRLTNFPVNYGAGKRGWYLDLGVQYSVAGTGVNTASATVVTPRERMLIPPIQLGGSLLAQSFVPSADPCSAGGDSFLYRLDPLTGSFLGARSFGDPDSGAIQVPGSLGLLRLYSRTASSVPPPGNGAQPSLPPQCPPGANCTCPPGFDYIFSTAVDGSLSGRCVPRGGIGAVRTWRQIIQ